MSFEIGRGTPQYSGRYACYLPGVGLPTVIRLFIVGRGWLTNLKEPIAGDVVGWIGPLPLFPENSVSAMPAQEFDL